MNINADFGMNQDFVLAKILLVYSSGHRAFATLHEPKSSPDGGPPYLDEGRPITMEFLKELGRQLGASLPKEILPASVLVRTVDMLVWWTPRQKRLMFYGDASDGRKLNGKTFPVPSLVFKVSGSELSVRALASAERPLRQHQADDRSVLEYRFPRCCLPGQHARASTIGTRCDRAMGAGFLRKRVHARRSRSEALRIIRKDSSGCGASLPAPGSFRPGISPAVARPCRNSSIPGGVECTRFVPVC